MPAPVYYIAVGVLAAATAVFIWWNSNERQPVSQRANRRNSDRYNGSGPGNSVNRRTRNIPEPYSKCMICIESPVTVKFLPCNHASMCEECAKKFFKSLEEKGARKACPYCRETVLHYKIF